MGAAKTATAPAYIGVDPWPYTGPIERVDGRRPFNHNLWPLGDDWFWAHHEIGQHIDSRWNMLVIALQDGRWATDMSVHSMERDETCYGHRCNFPDRRGALRAVAARLIGVARAARRWPGSERLTEADCAAIIAWARDVVARETGGQAPRPLTLLPRFVPVLLPAGLPLFDAADA